MRATVITFYSFKGGVGRTQALANVAVGLVNRGKNVVLVDMDLESPGLHAFFCPPDRLQEHIVPQPQIFYDFIKSVPNPTDFNIIQGIASLQFGNRYVSITSLQRELRRAGREMREEDLGERLRTLTESAPLVLERRLTTRQYRLLVGLFARHLRFVAGSENAYGR